MYLYTKDIYYTIPININNVALNIYLEKNPLRANGTVMDEITYSTQTITRRIDTDGTVLSNAVVSDIFLPTLNTIIGDNSMNITSTVLPTNVQITYENSGEYNGFSSVDVQVENNYVVSATISSDIVKDNLFDNCTNLTSITLSGTTTDIGKYAFNNCTNLVLTSLPNTVKIIDNYAFNNCSSVNISSLPTSLETIGDYAFSGTGLTGSVTIPKAVKTIGTNVFNGNAITSITIEGIPDSINSNAFAGMTSLTTINVPWVENTYSGAPWGADNSVTINYLQTTWENIRDVVRSGKANTYYPIGTSLFDDFDSTNTNRTEYEIVGYNKHFNEDLTNQGFTNSMTLCEKYTRYGVAVCPTDAMMYVTTEMPAGDYKFSVPTGWGSAAGKTFYFTTTASVPVNGQLVLGGFNAGGVGAQTPTTISCYTNNTDTTGITNNINLPISETEIVGATDLGTISTGNTVSTGTYGIFNHIHRVQYGSNNYYQSGIRQYMNSTTTNWWNAQTIFNRPHGLRTSQGILGTLNNDFVSVLTTPKIINISNNVFEYPSIDGTTFKRNTNYYITTDKLFLLSHTEVNLPTTPDLGTVLEYYSNAPTSGDSKIRVKYDRTSHSTARVWWFRTPNPTNACYVRGCTSAGALYSSNANNGYGCSPACVIQ